MFQLGIFPKMVMQSTHTEGKVCSRKAVNHVCCDHLATVVIRAILRCDSCLEAFRQVIEDWSQSVLVQSRQRFGCHLQRNQNEARVGLKRLCFDYLERLFQFGLKVLENQTGLVSAGDVGHPTLQKDPSLLYKIWNSCPMYLIESLSTEFLGFKTGRAIL